MTSPSSRQKVRDLATSPEVLTFLVVGGLGYVVDVGAFNLLRILTPLATRDPVWARVLAVVAAMVVTYVGNRHLTWRGRTGRSRRREVVLFVVFNLVGLAFSVAALLVSHDLLGLRSALADNVSANVVGLGLGTLFRFWSYRRFVFAEEQPHDHDRGQVTRVVPPWRGPVRPVTERRTA